MNRQQLKQAYQEGLIDEIKFKEELFKLATVKKSDKKPERIYEPVSTDDFLKLLKVTTKVEHKIAWILGYGSGLRISEILNLNPSDVKLSERKVFVRSGKGSKDRVVNSPKWLREPHLKYLPLKISARALELAFQRQANKAGFNEIIANYKRKNRNGIEEEVSINRYSVHSLRRGFGTRLIEAGVPLNQVQLLMGHSNISTTSKYLKANPTDAIQSVIDKDI